MYTKQLRTRDVQPARALSEWHPPCSQLAVPEMGVALVGDAGHGVTPNMGQGCNSALETVHLPTSSHIQAAHLRRAD